MVDFLTLNITFGLRWSNFQVGQTRVIFEITFRGLV
jgi:hypothetical protein